MKNMTEYLYKKYVISGIYDWKLLTPYEMKEFMDQFPYATEKEIVRSFNTANQIYDEGEEFYLWENSYV